MLLGPLHCSKEGMDFIFMILNYKYHAIWGARVATTEDASGKRLVAVGEDLRGCFVLTLCLALFGAHNSLLAKSFGRLLEVAVD